MRSPLYKYMSLENLISTLENGIYASCPRDFNDPYEWMDIEKPDDFRVCCLSNSANAKLMWAHYANCHKGVMLRIALPENYGEKDFVLRKVEYQSKKTIDGISDPFEKTIQKRQEMA